MIASACVRVCVCVCVCVWKGVLADTCVSQVIPGKWSQAGVHDDAPSTPHRHLGSSGTTGPDLMTNHAETSNQFAKLLIRRVISQSGANLTEAELAIANDANSAQTSNQVQKLCVEVLAWQAEHEVYIVHKLCSQLRRRRYLLVYTH